MTATIEDEAVKRAELDRLRADAQAAVALVLEQAVQNYRLGSGIVDGSYPMWDYDEHIEGMLRALAPADGLAAVEALRADVKGWASNATEAWRLMRDAENERDRLAVELAAAQQREARRTFPILKGDGAKIDYQLVADHAEQARSNHGQSVDRLAARGGLSWCELYAVLHNRKWEKVDTNEAMIACRSLEARYLAALSNNERKDDDTL